MSSVLESAIIFQGETLLQKSFYSKKKQEKIENRTTLISSVLQMAENIFEDNINNFTLGNYEIILLTEFIKDINESKKMIPIHMYSLAEKNIDKKSVLESMKTMLFQFINRYSRIDLLNKNLYAFEGFYERFDKIFKNFIEKSDDEIEKEKIENNKNFKKYKKEKYIRKRNNFSRGSSYNIL